MTIVSDFLRTERDGVEYFTLTLTGESGMSQRGLARACGVTNPAILKLASNLITKSPSKWLEPFVGKDLTLITNVTKNGGKVEVYTAEFCAAVIQHYAFKGNETAQDTLSATSAIGLTSYIQSQTGWLPENLKAAPQQHNELDRILNAPSAWERFYDKKFCDRISSTYGYKFYREVVYALLTPQEYYKLDKLSPKTRKHCLHQLIEPETKERMKPYLEKIQVMLNSVNTMDDFNRAYFREFGVWIDERYRDLLEGYWEIVSQDIAAPQQSAF